MLTIATITPQQGQNYYKQENYYSKSAALAHSQWWGKGAETLGLNGQIDDFEAYDRVVNGLSPDGKRQLREKPKHEQAKERAGVDLTFSAPKSVSLACLVGGDKRLEEAHRSAVRRTLELIEQRYPQTRVKGERVKTDNLTVALWHHDTSRELDPHLHTHCVVMNITQLPDGRWQSRTDENLYYNKILLGRIYRNELALECQRLGYKIESHPKELFEIEGYSKEQIESFSKRHEQILDKLAEIGTEPTTENKIWAWRRTRIRKNHEIDRQEMLPYWQEEAALYGIVHPTPCANLPLTTEEKVQEQLTEAVEAAIAHCSERRVAFTLEDIEKFISNQICPFSLSQIEAVVEEHPELLLRTFDGRFTTEKAVQRELQTIRLMQQGKGKVNPIGLEVGNLEGFTTGQKEAIALSATTTDRFIAWQGVAGAGKTYALNQVRRIAVEQGYTLRGFAPSAEAAKVLGEEVEIEATTVARLLHSKQPPTPQENQIWIVDEAGLLSAKDALALLERANREGARVILVGDTRQLSAVEAGSPFRSLQQAGMATAYLSESRRQKPPDLQKAVNLAAAGEINSSITHLAEVGRIEEISDREGRAERITSDYMALTPQERQQTLILAGTNAERLLITEQIRSQLKAEGSLGDGIEAIKLKARDLTQVQSCYTHNYQVGDVVLPTRTYRKQGLEKFEPYFVEEIRQDNLILSDLLGNKLTVNPMKFRKTVYARQTIEIAVGDRLRWTRNDKELGRRNGQEFTVTSIDGNTITIAYQNGKTENIHLYEPLHLDYALVSTVYASQGKTAERVLFSAAADTTLSQESFYVAISRAKYDLKIYADNREKLLKRALESNAQENSLDLFPLRHKVELKAQKITVTQKERNFDESTHARQSQPIDGKNIGRSISDRLNTSSRESGADRKQDRRSDQSEPINAKPRTVSRQSRETQRPERAAFSGTDTTVNQPAEQLQQLDRHANDINQRIESADGKFGTMETNTRHLAQNLDTLTRRNALYRGEHGSTVETITDNIRTAQEANRRSREAREQFTRLVDELRSTPLEEVAHRLGLERHHSDRHKWKSQAHIISIKDDKFYDHLAQKGGYGAINLVMHVQDCDFKNAVAWLEGRSTYAIFEQPLSLSIPKKEPEKAPSCNIRDESRWPQVKRYLTEMRSLPEPLVESLQQQGILSADSRQNVMFFRHALDEDFKRGEAIGAGLRGTQGNFKGLTTGTRRDEGYFWFEIGQGAVERVALTESPIDAMSLASLESPGRGTTAYLSIDGAGAIPENALRKVIESGGQVILAHDSDRAGEEMAWKVASTLLKVSRIKPTVNSKDWNEQLKMPAKAGQQNPSNLVEWQRIAQALAHSQKYQSRIATVATEVEIGHGLSTQALAALEKDFQTYRQLQDRLWEWYESAQALNKTEGYLRRITEVALEFNRATDPVPLSEKAIAAMEQDLKNNQQQQTLSPEHLWHEYSKGIVVNDALRVKAIAQKAFEDGCSVELATQILKQDPYLQQAERQLGKFKSEQLLSGAIRSVQSQKPYQEKNQKEYGWEVEE